MARKENISALAQMLGIENGPNGLREEDLTVKRLDFYDGDNHIVASVSMTEMNKAGRLFFQQFSNEGIALIPLHDMFRVVAKMYFAELWEDEPDPSRTLIYAIRTCDFVRIVLK
jgi:hypothetical protein